MLIYTAAEDHQMRYIWLGSVKMSKEFLSPVRTIYIRLRAYVAVATASAPRDRGCFDVCRAARAVPATALTKGSLMPFCSGVHDVVGSSRIHCSLQYSTDLLAKKITLVESGQETASHTLPGPRGS